MMPINQTHSKTSKTRENRYHPYLDDIGMADAMRILAVNHLRARPIYDTWDIHLPETNRRIEVKASGPENQSNGRGGYGYRFGFSNNQLKEKAFDYALCLGYNWNAELEAWYLIPQKYLTTLNRINSKQRGKNSKTKPSLWAPKAHLRIRPIEQVIRYSITGKYESCREDINPLLIDDDGAFTRKKNYITKKLLSLKGVNPNKGTKHNSYYNLEEEQKLKSIILKLWNKGYNRTEIKKKVPKGLHTVSRICKELNLPHSNPYRSKK